MAASLSFRWLEILEKEFDKAFVDLDLLLGEIDPDQCELTYDGRQKMTALSAAFAQLCHKAQTIFQTNAKLEVSSDEKGLLVISRKAILHHELLSSLLCPHCLMSGLHNIVQELLVLSDAKSLVQLALNSGRYDGFLFYVIISSPDFLSRYLFPHCYCGRKPS